MRQGSPPTWAASYSAKLLVQCQRHRRALTAPPSDQRFGAASSLVVPVQQLERHGNFGITCSPQPHTRQDGFAHAAPHGELAIALEMADSD